MPDMKTWTANGVTYTLPFAPDGYGLGGSGVGTTDLNAVTGCGFSAFTSDCAHAPFDYGMCLTLSRYGSQFTQIATNPWMGSSGEIAIRHRYQDVWYEWEYVNPPMLPGVEYRTTERHNGEPVFAKRVLYTTTSTIGTSGTSADVFVPHGILNSENIQLVRCDARVENRTLPYNYGGTGWTLVTDINWETIRLRVINDTWGSGYTFEFDLYYVK